MNTSATGTPDCVWEIPAGELRLSSNEIHVWRAALDLSPSLVENFWVFLSPDERARAERYRFTMDRNRFIVARGFLRLILSQYLHFDAAGLRFAYSTYGKPSLAGEFSLRTLRFNLSHSHGLALVALSDGRELGVDIERIRADSATEDIAKRYFSSHEFSAMRALPRELRTEAFFNCWTRKEAYIKAVGEGLSFPLNQFDVSLVPGEPASLLRVRGNKPEALRWSMKDLSIDEEYKAAIIAEGQGWRLRCLKFHVLRAAGEPAPLLHRGRAQ